MGLYFTSVNVPQFNSTIQTAAQKQYITERMKHNCRYYVRVRETSDLDLLKLWVGWVGEVRFSENDKVSEVYGSRGW